MSKIIKRLLIFFIIAFVFVNGSIFIILNEPFVQNYVVRLINNKLSNKYKINLKVTSFSYSLFLRTLTIKNLQIRENDDTQSSDLLLAVDNINLRISPLTSYLKNRLIVDRVFISNSKLFARYNSKGNLIIPKVFDSSDQVEEPVKDNPHLIEDVIEYFPDEVVFNATNIEFGQKESNNYQNVFIKQMKFVKHENIVDNTNRIEMTSVVQNSIFVFPKISKSVHAESLILNGILYQNGILDLSDINLRSDIINLDATLSGVIKTSSPSFQYNFHIKESNLSAQNIFDVFEMKSTGMIQLTGRVIGELKAEGDSIGPDFVGQAKWQDTTLDDFNLFSGQANVKFHNKTLYYNNAVLKTPSKGTLYASGQYQFYDEFYFENEGHIESLSLKELLDSVHAKQDILDAHLNTNKVRVTGHLKNKLTAIQHNTYDVAIESLVDVTDLHLIPLKKEKVKSLLPMQVNLHIDLTDKGLNFNQSEGYIVDRAKRRTGIIKIVKSHLIFDSENPDMLIQLEGKNINLGLLNYFIEKNVSGNLAFNGVLTYNKKNPGVQFKSQIQAENGNIDGIPFLKTRGNFALFDEYGEISDFVFEIPKKSSQTQDTYINLRYLSFRYKDMYSNIIVNLQGNLANVFHLLKGRIPAVFNQFDGTLSTLNLTMSGYFSDIDTWEFKIDSEIKPLITPRGSVSFVSINLLCSHDECRQSKIYFEGFERSYIKSNATPQITTNANSLPDSSGIIFLYDVSLTKSNFAFQFQNVPIDFFNYSSENITGNLYGLGELEGTWKHPTGAVDVNIDHVLINNRNIGHVQALYQSDQSANSEFKLIAFDNQLTAVMHISPESGIQDSDVRVVLSNFNIARLLGPSIKFSNNLYSRINANFLLSGKWDPDFKKNVSFWKHWKGSGIIENSDLQIGFVNLNITTPKEIIYQNGIMTFEKLVASSGLSSILLNGSYDFSTTQIDANSIADINLKDFNKALPMITEGEGKIKGEFQISGAIHQPKFSGHTTINAEKIIIRGDSTPYTDISGYIAFKDTMIEIQKFYAAKGDGSLILTGGIDFTDMDKNDHSGYPVMNLHLVTKNTEFQFPVPIFKTVDFKIDSDLIISGRKPPFLIAGKIDIQRLSLIKDISCNDLYFAYKDLPKTDPDMLSAPIANLNIDVQALQSILIESKCLHARFSTIDTIKIVGNTNAPLLDGELYADNATLAILKARFRVERSKFMFNEKNKFDPIISLNMIARVASYDIYWDVNGRASVAKLNLMARPEYLPNGNPITTDAILFMITTGQMPTQDSVNTLLEASSGLYSYFGTNNNALHVFDQTMSTVTGGLFDTFTFAPSSTNGEIGVHLTATKYFSQRFTFGVSFEGSPTVSKSTLFLYYLLNRYVSFTGDYSVANIDSQTGQVINDLGAGLRFNFGTW